MAGILDSKRVVVVARDCGRDMDDRSSSAGSHGKKGCTVKLQEGLDYISIVIQEFLEARFFWFGVFMATYPLRTICIAMLACGALGSGFFFWEKREDNDVWLPYESDLREKKDWLASNFPTKMFYETALIVSDNVLAPEVLSFLHELDEVVSKLKTDEESWESLCARPGAIIPLMGSTKTKNGRIRRAIEASPKIKAISGELTQLSAESKPSIISANNSKLPGFQQEGTNLVTQDAGKTKELVTDVEEEEEKVFVPFLGFEVSKDVDRMFKKYMKHADTGGECMAANILHVLDDGTDPDQVLNYSTLHPDAILGKFTKAFHRRTLLSDAQNISAMLKNIRLDEQGRVVGAEATMMAWLVKSPPLKANILLLWNSRRWLFCVLMIQGATILSFSILSRSEGELAPEYAKIHEWERLFVDSILEYTKNRSLPGVKVYVFSHSSFLDAMASMQDHNMTILFSGFALILFYVTITLGKFNCMEQRILLSLVGVANVGLSILASYGMCSFAGLFFGPIHPILPFLLLGIGVDDMFVIVQSLKNLSTKEKSLPVPERIGSALKSAGVSITITSATDILAFSIGATTVMPALSSFCLYAAAGIMCVFSLQLTIFVPCLAMDEMRLDDRRNACCPCLPMRPSYQPNKCSQTPYMALFFKRIFSPFVLSTPFKVFTIMACVGMAAINSWGVWNLEQNFDPRKYITWGSYQDLYLRAVETYFPDHGENSAFYISDITFWKESETLEKLYYRTLAQRTILPDSVDFWHHSFVEWMRKNDRGEPAFEDELEYQEAVREFLVSTPEGHHYLQDLTFNGTLLGEFTILTSRLKFKHVPLLGSADKEEAMKAVFDIERTTHFDTATPGKRSLGVFTMAYIQWQANYIISGELFRNLGLTLSAVCAVSLVLIGDVRVSLWVFLCVTLTLVDIAGSMHYWGLKIEIVTSICLILAVGLAVDYAAHVGHMFVALRGTKQERAQETLGRIGPAVFNGAFSTFLAFIMLAYTDDYAFSAFFKVFFCVVFYGLFHGLIFLPVILSLVGPSTIYQSPQASSSNGMSAYTPGIPTNTNGCSAANGQIVLTPCHTTKEFLCDESDDDNVEPKANGVANHSPAVNRVKYDNVDESAEANITFLAPREEV